MAEDRALARLFAVPGPVFTARYRGKWGLCGQGFPKGERICYVAKKAVAHEECAVSSSPVNPVNDSVLGAEERAARYGPERNQPQPTVVTSCDVADPMRQRFTCTAADLVATPTGLSARPFERSLMTRLCKSDQALLNAATRDLRNAPKVYGYGRADSLRSAPFSARYRGVCPRCRKRIDVGDDIRFHNDFADPVHVGCREPSARTEPGRTNPKPARRKEIPVCPSCWTQHAGQCW